MTSAILVPICKAVMIGRKQLCPPQLVSVCKLAEPKRPGSRPGRITVWPRLLMGNSSVNPCNSDRAMVCQIFRCNVVMDSYSLTGVNTSARPFEIPRLYQHTHYVHQVSTGKSNALFSQVRRPPPGWRGQDYRWGWAESPCGYRYSRGWSLQSGFRYY